MIAGFFSLPKLSEAGTPFNQTPIKSKGLTIDQILSVSYPAVLNKMCHNETWACPRLRTLKAQGRLMTRPLGFYVEVIEPTGPNKIYHVNEICIPIYWSKDDDLKLDTEAKKINFVKTLLENAFEAHDALLFDRIGAGKAVASTQYKYQLTPTEYEPHARIYTRKIWTGVAFIN